MTEATLAELLLKPVKPVKITRPSPKKETEKSQKKSPAAKGVSSPGGKGASLEPPEPFLLDVSQVLLDKRCDIVKSIEWVAMHIDVEMTKQIMGKCPSAIAASMWKHYSKDENRAEFYERVFVRLIPPKSQLDADAMKKFDDGQVQIDLADRILKRHKDK